VKPNPFFWKDKNSLHLTHLTLQETRYTKRGGRRNQNIAFRDYFLNQPIIKGVIVVDEDVNVNDLNEIFWALMTRVNFEKSIFLRREKPGCPIDPTAKIYYREESQFYGLYPKTTKIGINATKPLDGKERFKKVEVPLSVAKRLKGVLGIDRGNNF